MIDPPHRNNQNISLGRGISAPVDMNKLESKVIEGDDPGGRDDFVEAEVIILKASCGGQQQLTSLKWFDATAASAISWQSPLSVAMHSRLDGWARVLRDVRPE